MEYELLRSPMISYRSLLYNTTVLYDKTDVFLSFNSFIQTNSFTSTFLNFSAYNCLGLYCIYHCNNGHYLNGIICVYRTCMVLHKYNYMSSGYTIPLRQHEEADSDRLPP